MDAMLDDMGADQFVEWMAFEEIRAQEQRKAEQAAKAEAGVRNHRRGGR